MPLAGPDSVVDGAAYAFLLDSAKEMSENDAILQKVALAFDITLEEAHQYILMNPQIIFDI